MPTSYQPRLVDSLLAETVASFPAALVVGPRACGKTTSAARIAAERLSLDRVPVARAVDLDPDAALRGRAEPLLIDEWQVVPSILGAVKRTVDVESRPGRFVITGSVRSDLDSKQWPGTGRLIRVPMSSLTQREIQGCDLSGTFIDFCADHGVEALPRPADSLDVRDYIELAITGGFPEPALHLTVAERERWYESYIGELVTRDAAEVDTARDPARLRTFVEAVAISSTTTTAMERLIAASGTNARTARAYERVLINLGILELVPAWWTNRLKRLTQASKRVVTDAGLVAGALRLDTAQVMNDSDLIGKLVETFVFSQLRPEVPIAKSHPKLHHLRTEQGRHEVDAVLDLRGGRILGIEIKATAAPSHGDASHLMWLRDQLGGAFVGGVVFHTGTEVFRLDDRIVAAPISCLWGAFV